jgi:hypothetical protein
MPLSVALLMPPKPTAMIVMPSCFSVAAVSIAVGGSYQLFCSPSVKMITRRMYVVASTVSSCVLAESRPALMCVPPVVGYVDVP